VASLAKVGIDALHNLKLVYDARVIWLLLLQLAGSGDLRARFEADAGHPRLILLLSPT
jgi:hypothetical protein